MLNKPVNKLEILIIISLQLLIVVLIYKAIKPPKKTDLDMKLAEAAFELKVLNRSYELLEVNSDKAKQLSENGQYQEAAILLFQGAAARACLFPDSHLQTKENPSIFELDALRAFDKVVDQQNAYEQILKIKYPDWEGQKILAF